MTIDPRWDEIFRERGWGRWPETTFVRFVMKRWGNLDEPDRSNVNFLELGSGFGAQLWFLAQEGFCALGIEASDTAVAACTSLEVHHADVTADWAPLYLAPQDCIFDVCCLQHVHPLELPQVIERVGTTLKPGGVFWSMWGFAVEDSPTSPDMPPLYGRDQSNLIPLLHQHVGNTRIGNTSVMLPGSSQTHRHWIIEAEKRA